MFGQGHSAWFGLSCHMEDPDPVATCAVQRATIQEHIGRGHGSSPWVAGGRRGGSHLWRMSSS